MSASASIRCLVAIALAVGAAATARADALPEDSTDRQLSALRIPSVDETIEEVGALPDNGSFQLVSRVGYKYRSAGLMRLSLLDMWRFDGEWVAYDRIIGNGSMYRVLEQSEIDALGLATPWRYYFPPGLLLLAIGLELLLVRRLRPSVKSVLVIGGVLTVFGAVLRAKGLAWEFVIPVAAGIYHIVGGVRALRQPVRAAPVALLEDEGPPVARVQRDEPRPSAPLIYSGPNGESDPFRMPPQPPPIVVQRPKLAPAAAPIEHDPNAEKPKILT